MHRLGEKTAFVFAGGGSLGAIQVGMLRVLLSSGVLPDFVVGASVGRDQRQLFCRRPGRCWRCCIRAGLVGSTARRYFSVHDGERHWPDRTSGKCCRSGQAAPLDRKAFALSAARGRANSPPHYGNQSAGDGGSSVQWSCGRGDPGQHGFARCLPARAYRR